MSQAELNTDVQNLAAAITTIQTAEGNNTSAVAAVAAELAALQQQVAAGGTVDLTGLESLINGPQGLVAAAASVTAGVTAVQGLVPAPAPAPTTPTA